MLAVVVVVCPVCLLLRVCVCDLIVREDQEANLDFPRSDQKQGSKLVHKNMFVGEVWSSQFRQLTAVTWKNWLLKKAHVISLIAEVFLPIGVMALLTIIKQVAPIFLSAKV